MSRHIELGKRGEQLARDYIVQQAFSIVSLNWKYSYYEIDIIASRKGILHFIEVKTRSNTRFGFPEESVDRRKLRSIMSAADHYLYLHPGWTRIQYDVLSVFISPDRPPEFFFIEDVYQD